MTHDERARIRREALEKAAKVVEKITASLVLAFYSDTHGHQGSPEDQDWWDPLRQACDAIRALADKPVGDGWQPIDVEPERNCTVLFYVGNVVFRLDDGSAAPDIPNRELRYELGFYNEHGFAELLTGHSIEERRLNGDVDLFPTHYLVLPSPPPGLNAGVSGQEASR